MPQRPPWLSEEWDVEGSGSRFTLAPAIAVGIPEAEWELRQADTLAARALSDYVGAWVHDEQEGLGRGQALSGSVGRGAAGLAAVLIFIGLNVAAGVISVSAGMAWKRFVERFSDSLVGSDRKRFHVSRGAAAYLAVAEVAARFGEEDSLELEAVEEPSTIAGIQISELSYVGLEPWIVLLRNREKQKRYVVVVSAMGGDILGAIDTPLGEWEAMFLPAPEESTVVNPPKGRRRWRPRRRT